MPALFYKRPGLVTRQCARIRKQFSFEISFVLAGDFTLLQSLMRMCWATYFTISFCTRLMFAKKVINGLSSQPLQS